MNLVSFARFYICCLLFNISGWIYFGYLMYYTKNLTTQTCNDYSKELIDTIKIAIGISMTLISMNLLAASSNALNNEDYNNININHLYCNFLLITLLLSVSGLSSFALFCITSGMTDIHCSNTDYELGLKLSVYGTLWIAFLEFLSFTVKTLLFWYNILINAKLHLLCVNCYNNSFDLFKKYTQRRIAIEPSSISSDISIPMPVSTSKIVCSVCYDNSVTLLLEPCNHICICTICHESLVTKQCPICKTQISTTRKVFFASPNCSN